MLVCRSRMTLAGAAHTGPVALENCMDVGRVASLFIKGLESFVAHNEMVFTLTFEEPYDAERLLAAFIMLVRSRPALQLRFVQTDRGSFQWTGFDGEELERHLLQQSAAFHELRTLAEIYEDHIPTGQGLPLRIRRADNLRVLLLANHVFTNGFGVFHWIEEWLRIYGGDDHPVEKRPARLRGRGNGIAGLLFVAAYVLSFVRRAGWHASRDTVDLSRGAIPVPGGRGYAIQTHLLTNDETQQVLARGRNHGLSVAELMCSAVTHALFSAQPEKSRVCLSVPADLGAYVPKFSPELPGNYTGSLIIQVRSSGESEPQIKAGFGWLRRRVHYWLPVLLGTFTSEPGLYRSFARQAALPIPERAPFENFSAAISSVGVVRGTQAQRYLAAISAHTRMQTVFLCAMTLKGRMSIEVSAPCDLFAPEDVFRVAAQAITNLTGQDLSVSATTR